MELQDPSRQNNQIVNVIVLRCLRGEGTKGISSKARKKAGVRVRLPLERRFRQHHGRRRRPEIHAEGDRKVPVCRPCLAGEDMVVLPSPRATGTKLGCDVAVKVLPSRTVGTRPGFPRFAAVNGMSQCVVSGSEEEIDALFRVFASRGLEGRRVRATRAFHSRQMDPIIPRFRRVLQHVTFDPPSTPYVSCVTGDWMGRCGRPCSNRSRSCVIRTRKVIERKRLAGVYYEAQG